MQETLFLDLSKAPLAERLRPKDLSEISGQEHLLSDDAVFKKLINKNMLPSCIFWGPPGVGKTTIARLLSKELDACFIAVSAIFSGVSDLKKQFEIAKKNKEVGRKTILFIDEIHRFNRAQQDSFLPYVEDGTIILVGATTENPSFELNTALLSRCQVFTLKALSEDALLDILENTKRKIENFPSLSKDAKDLIISLAEGDGRYFLNLIERIINISIPKEKTLKSEDILKYLERKKPIYDKKQEGHYNLISAFHKSMRASDVDASLYYLARMLSAGEDEHYILRRILVFASEDIGLSDPNALTHVISAWQSFDRLGKGEGYYAIASATVYCATAPKSNAVYSAFKEAMKSASITGNINPPMHILNAPTKLMKDIGYNKGYKYDHDYDSGISGQDCFPDEIDREEYYKPSPRGFEKDLQKRLRYFKKIREESDF